MGEVDVRFNIRSFFTLSSRFLERIIFQRFFHTIVVKLSRVAKIWTFRLYFIRLIIKIYNIQYGKRKGTHSYHSRITVEHAQKGTPERR